MKTMSKASEAANKAYPSHIEIITSIMGTQEELHGFARDVFQESYEKAEQDIISLIESRIGEILGDAQPAPVLRAELRELITKIKEQ